MKIGEHIPCSYSIHIKGKHPLYRESVYNGSKYHCNFIVKELGNEFKGQFECMGK